MKNYLKNLFVELKFCNRIHRNKEVRKKEYKNEINM